MAEKNSIPQFVNSESIMSDSNYVKWLSDLKGRIRIVQLKAAIKVNEELHKLYWSLGEDICNKQKLYKWGTNFIKQLLCLRFCFVYPGGIRLSLSRNERAIRKEFH